jgi:hypothetical protein
VRVLLLLIVLSGCGGGSTDEPENHGYGWEFDTTSALGQKVRLSNVGVGDGQLFDDLFQRALSCTGIQAPPPPYVVFVKAGELSPHTGFYYPNPPLILLDERDAFAYSHEVIHYLLDVSTGNLDPEHKSRLFATCT